jgi:hypothetical protein
MASLFDGAGDWWNGGGKSFASNALLDLSYGLANGRNLNDALGQTAQRTAALQPQRDLQAEQIAAKKQQAQQLQTAIANLRDKYQRPDLADAVAQGYDVNKAWQDVLTKKAPVDLSSTTEGRQQLASQYNLTGADAQNYVLTGKLPGSNQSVRAGLGQPIPLRNKQTGETVPFMPMSDGTYINPLTQKVADDSWEFDPAYIAAQRAQGAAVGTAVGGSQFNLPAAKQNVDLEMANIDAILNDKEGLSQTFGNLGGFNVNGVGYPNQWTPTLPNTPKANLNERVKQVVGQNFLQAYSSLKGAGAITEVEGSKAQEAMARLGSAQDQASFEQALNDLKAVLKLGYDRMSAQAGTLPSIGGGTGVTGNQPAQTSTGVQWSYSP